MVRSVWKRISCNKTAPIRVLKLEAAGVEAERNHSPARRDLEIKQKAAKPYWFAAFVGLFKIKYNFSVFQCFF